MMKNQKGFTLIELLIVIAIIGLLAALALVSLTAAQQRARDTKRVADMKSFQTSLELYYNENASYPVLEVDDGEEGTEEIDTWDELADAMSAYISSLSTPPTDGEVYAYLMNDTLDQYFIASTLEDENHQVLSQDLDGVQPAENGGATWILVTSSAAAVADGEINCGTATATGDDTDGDINGDSTADGPAYCLGGQASQ